jgi:NAD(P) transhydrogenase subunit alpha
MPLKLGIPRETAKGERRVAIDPFVISRLSKLGVEIYVEKSAGKSALISDSQFEGATLVADIKALSEKADIIWRVQAPTDEEVGLMRDGTVLIGTLMAHNNISMLKALQDIKQLLWVLILRHVSFLC